MRLDKLTTKFQEALSDAQSLAVGQDTQMIEPPHLLVAMLHQDDGRASSLLHEPGPTSRRSERLDQAVVTVCRRWKATGAGAGWPRSGQAAAGHREGSPQARRPVHRQRVVPAGRWPTARAGRRAGRGQRPDPQEPGGGHRRRARRPERGQRRGRGPARGAEEVHAST